MLDRKTSHTHFLIVPLNLPTTMTNVNERRFSLSQLVLSVCLLATASALANPIGAKAAAARVVQGEEVSSRRNILKNLLAASVTITAAGAVSASALPAFAAAEDDKDIDVYFGCGCFWHVQHELVEAERNILGRSDLELTARAGYAGGKGGMKDGKVCYNNARQVSQYGALGHAEVVRLNIPSSTFPLFAAEYFKLFDKNGYRPDQAGDRGLEYRSVVGLPGGSQSPYAKLLIETSKQNGDKLDFAKGSGSDPDARGLAFVMDTADFPFFVGEQYHQFHDGFNFGENYPGSYNGLAATLAKVNKLGVSDCPNGLLGLGALGL
jgi:peptide methionine sulfoxide reductase MsrA